MAQENSVRTDASRENPPVSYPRTTIPARAPKSTGQASPIAYSQYTATPRLQSCCTAACVSSQDGPPTRITHPSPDHASTSISCESCSHPSRKPYRVGHEDSRSRMHSIQGSTPLPSPCKRKASATTRSPAKTAFSKPVRPSGVLAALYQRLYSLFMIRFQFVSSRRSCPNSTEHQTTRHDLRALHIRSR